MPLQAEVSNLPELDLKILVSYLTWALGTKLMSFGRSASALRHCDVSVTPLLQYLDICWPSKNIYLLNEYFNIFVNIKTFDIPKFF